MGLRSPHLRRLIHALLRARRQFRAQQALRKFRTSLSTAASDPGSLGRIIAFYLPQFHPIPENDLWWGKGFTEWTNVAAARPQFRGHRQPRIPGELGFYDLRLPETRSAQAALAAAHGIDAFCYWHYWFEGHRLLDRPFEDVLRSGQPDHPFCLAWANESWTRTWLGVGEVLLEQTYSPDDDRRHAAWLAEAFADPRYVRIGDRPLFLMYRPADHPEAHRFIQALADACCEQGIARPFTLGMNGWRPSLDCTELGFAGTVDFQPQLGDIPAATAVSPSVWRLLRNLRRGIVNRHVLVDTHRSAYERMLGRRLQLTFPTFPVVMAGWDNTPRRGRRATILQEVEPQDLRRAIAEHLVAGAARPIDERIMFVNAWNEWAEGNYLEPDTDRGRSLLEAIRDGREDARQRLS